MREKIEEIINDIYTNLKELRASGKSADEILGVEIMALNAICNAEKTLKK